MFFSHRKTCLHHLTAATFTILSTSIEASNNNYINLHVFFLSINFTPRMALIITLSILLKNDTFLSLFLLKSSTTYLRSFFNKNLPNKTSPHSQNLIHLILVLVTTVNSEPPLTFNAFPW